VAESRCRGSECNPIGGRRGSEPSRGPCGGWLEIVPVVVCQFRLEGVNSGLEFVDSSLIGVGFGRRTRLLEAESTLSAVGTGRWR